MYLPHIKTKYLQTLRFQIDHSLLSLASSWDVGLGLPTIKTNNGVQEMGAVKQTSASSIRCLLLRSQPYIPRCAPEH